MNRKFFVKKSSRFFLFSAILPVVFFLFLFVIDANSKTDSTKQDTQPEEIIIEVVHIKTIKLNTVETKPINTEMVNIERVNIETLDIKPSPKEVLQGEIYQKKGDYKKAEEFYLRAVKKYPRAYGAQKAQEHLVLLYLETKNFPAAEKTLSEVYSEFSEDKETFSYYQFLAAEGHFYEKNYVKAIEQWHELFDKYPENRFKDETTYLLATSYERAGDRKKAIEYYQKVINEYPHTYYAYRAPYNLGNLYREEKDYDKAIYWLEQQEKLYSDDSLTQRAIFLQGVIYLFDLNQPQKAIKIFQRYTEVYPETENTPVAMYNLALCDEKMDNKQEAIKVLEQAVDKYKFTYYGMDLIQKLIQLQNQI